MERMRTSKSIDHTSKTSNDSLQKTPTPRSNSEFSGFNITVNQFFEQTKDMKLENIQISPSSKRTSLTETTDIERVEIT